MHFIKTTENKLGGGKIFSLIIEKHETIIYEVLLYKSMYLSAYMLACTQAWLS